MATVEDQKPIETVNGEEKPAENGVKKESLNGAESKTEVKTEPNDLQQQIIRQIEVILV